MTEDTRKTRRSWEEGAGRCLNFSRRGEKDRKIKTEWMGKKKRVHGSNKRRDNRKTEGGTSIQGLAAYGVVEGTM